jgi:T-complex protein 1 subunit beta
MTTLSSKIILHNREHFGSLAVLDVLRLKGYGNLEYIKLIKKPGGTLKDSIFAAGFILKKFDFNWLPQNKEEFQSSCR